jgi:predicted ATPase/DNA-binding SARP family transcriptional activator
MPGLEIRVLGPFEVRLGGDRVAVSGSKRDALLAVLGLARGRVMAVEELVDAVWEEDLPAAPRNAVQHHVARLRAALGADRIVASQDGYSVKDAWVDAPCFEELLAKARVDLREGDARGGAESASQALALWRGAPLHGLTDTSWLRAEAQRLEALRVDALEERFEAALALGEHREIISGVRAALEESPFRERLRGQLMLALYRSGRQADALEAFQEARRVLGKELGLEPGPELRWLQEAILAHDPAIAPVPVAPRRRGNLPAASTSFVDREQELRQLRGLLEDHRLVTLVGPPGVGKTRLALEAVRSLEEEVRGGTWLVELARARGGVEVGRLVADALEVTGADPLGEVLARLRDADAIVLFDACEHALAEAGHVVAAVLAGCPHVRVLATSREALHLAGEARVTVGPLPIGDPGSADGASSPAVQLFAARASAARPGFDLTDEAVPVAAEIARWADGLPLAIELAAARLSVLGLAELRSMVERRLALLGDRPASDPIRTALQELVGWSYELLHGDEQTLLHLIAVHRGGASLPSLLALGANDGLDEATVTHLLGALADKSIVTVAFPDEEARYDLLDTVRDYTLEVLADADCLAPVRQAHAEYFATIAEGARAGLRGRDWLTWTKRLERENPNLWAALMHARDARDPDVAIRLGGSLGLYFLMAERVSEGRRFLELALAVASDDGPIELRLELLAWLSQMATEERDLDAALAGGERALALASTVPASSEFALANIALSIAHRRSGDGERAAALADEARGAYAEAQDDWGIAMSSFIRAGVAAAAGDMRTFSAMLAEARRRSEAIPHDANLPLLALCEAWAAEQQGDRDASMDAYRRALDASRRARFHVHASVALSGLGSLAFADGDLLQAEDLFRQALAAAEHNPTSFPVAHARVKLAGVFAAAGETEPAERLYRRVLEWSETDRPHRARETQFIALVGSPAVEALLGLAELADARGDTAAADELRVRAELTPA